MEFLKISNMRRESDRFKVTFTLVTSNVSQIQPKKSVKKIVFLALQISDGERRKYRFVWNLL